MSPVEIGTVTLSRLGPGPDPTFLVLGRGEEHTGIGPKGGSLDPVPRVVEVLKKPDWTRRCEDKEVTVETPRMTKKN